ETFFTEIDTLVADGVDVEGRLYVSDRAHLVLPYHKLVDSESSASKEIGTTGRGIGPAYEDKIARRGVRVVDLRHPSQLEALVSRGVEHANAMLEHYGSAKRADVRRRWTSCTGWRPGSSRSPMTSASRCIGREP